MTTSSIRRTFGLAGLGALLLLWLAAVVALPALASGPWPVVAVVSLLAGLLLTRVGPRWRRPRRLLVGLLGCWLGLLAWSEFSPGGAAPAAKSDPGSVRIVTWNIHCGQDDGPPWERFDWPARKQSLRVALGQARPDILCVQEARPGQVAFLEQSLPGH